MLIRTIETLPLGGRELLRGTMLLAVLAVGSMLLLLGKELLGLLLVRLGRCLLKGNRSGLGDGLGCLLRHVWLLVCPRLRLVRIVLGLRLGRWWRWGLDDRGRRLEVLLVLMLVLGLLSLLLALLLLLPVRAVAIIRVELRLISGTSRCCGGGLLSRL